MCDTRQLVIKWFHWVLCNFKNITIKLIMKIMKSAMRADLPLSKTYPNNNVSMDLNADFKAAVELFNNGRGRQSRKATGNCVWVYDLLLWGFKSTGCLVMTCSLCSALLCLTSSCAVIFPGFLPAKWIPCLFSFYSFLNGACTCLPASWPGGLVF